MLVDEIIPTIPLTESMLSTAHNLEADQGVHTQLIGGNENQRSKLLKQVSKNYYTIVTNQLHSILDNYSNSQSRLPFIKRFFAFLKITHLTPTNDEDSDKDSIVARQILSEQLNQFLQSPWLAAMYTAFPKNPATKLLVEIAFNLAKLDGTSALDKLFNRHIQQETHSNYFNNLSDASVEDILHILKTHVLWDNYLIPVKVLAEKRNDPNSLWHKNGLYNPYFTDFNNPIATKNYLFISPAIYQRIIQHSDTTRQINDYQEAYTKTQEDAGSLLGQLILLGKRFSSNDSHTGIGKSTQAGIGAAIAFMQFYCDFYEHINATQKSTIPEALRNEIELIKNYLSETKYTLELISNLPNHNRQNAKPRTIYLAEDGRYILKNMAGSVVEGMLDTQQISLKNLTQNLNKQAFLDNILSYLAHNGGHTPTPEQINTDQMSTCIGTRGYNLRQLTAQHQTILSKIVLDQQYQTSCITAVKSILNQALTEFETSLNNKSYQGNDALIITPDLLNQLNIDIIFDSDAKLSLLDPLTTDECDQLFTKKPALLNQIKQLLTPSEYASTASIEKLVWLITGMPIAPLDSLLAHLKKASFYIVFTSTKDIVALLITLTPEKLAIVCQHCINWPQVTESNLANIASSLTPEQNNIFTLSTLTHKIKSYDELMQFIGRNKKFSLTSIKNHLTNYPPLFMTSTALDEWLSSNNSIFNNHDQNSKKLKQIITTILSLPNHLQKMTALSNLNKKNYYESILFYIHHHINTPQPSLELMLNLTTTVTQDEQYIKSKANLYRESYLLSDWRCSIYTRNKESSQSEEEKEHKVRNVYTQIKKFYEMHKSSDILSPTSQVEYNIMMSYNYIINCYGIAPTNLNLSILSCFINKDQTSEQNLTQIQSLTQNTYFTNLIKTEIKKIEVINFRANLFNTLKIPEIFIFLETIYLGITIGTIIACISLLYTLLVIGTIIVALGLLTCLLLMVSAIPEPGFIVLSGCGIIFIKAIEIICYFTNCFQSIYNQTTGLTTHEYSAADIAAASIDYIPAIDVFDLIPQNF